MGYRTLHMDGIIMTKMTLAEIVETLQDNEITVEAFINRDNMYSKPNLPKELGRIVVISKPNFEEYEEQGRHDTDSYVNHFVDHDIYVKTMAQVDSYSSNETYPYGYGKQVYPKEKVVTVYE